MQAEDATLAGGVEGAGRAGCTWRPSWCSSCRSASTTTGTPASRSSSASATSSSDRACPPWPRRPTYVHYQSPGYDGQFYAQLAVEPLLRDRRIDEALDTPPYRARRILFSWTAYLLGLGRPAWILKVYAVQNIVAWLLLAWLLLRWFPPHARRATSCRGSGASSASA